jgi:hypothetical protein
MTTNEEQLPLAWLIEQMDKNDWGYLPRWKKDDIIEEAKQKEIKERLFLDNVIATQNELINVLEIQLVDLLMMSKIELGEDVIEKISTLKNQLKQ